MPDGRSTRTVAKTELMCSDFVPPYSMSPQHAGMMPGAMPPMRIPSGAGGPRGAPMRGPMSRGDYGK